MRAISSAIWILKGDVASGPYDIKNTCSNGEHACTYMGLRYACTYRKSVVQGLVHFDVLSAPVRSLGLNNNIHWKRRRERCHGNGLPQSSSSWQRPCHEFDWAVVVDRSQFLRRKVKIAHSAIASTRAHIRDCDTRVRIGKYDWWLMVDDYWLINDWW